MGIDRELLRKALQPHVPLIRFGRHATTRQTTLKKTENMREVGHNVSKLWYQDRPRRPILMDKEIETINVLNIYSLLMIAHLVRGSILRKLWVE